MTPFRAIGEILSILINSIQNLKDIHDEIQEEDIQSKMKKSLTPAMHAVHKLSLIIQILHDNPDRVIKGVSKEIEEFIKSNPCPLNTNFIKH